jgi:alpha-glucoside transport system permease protein
VWRDTRPGENQRGVVETGELGVPDVVVRLIDAQDQELATGVTEPDGSFRIDEVPPGAYRARIPAAEFREPWGGVTWLGPELVTMSAIVAGVWIWGGFALLVIASGLAAIPRELQEAARVDGAGEWQVFRRVTVPLLAPVLGVVFVTLTINALKMFDLIIGIAPGSVQDEANVIALEMWRTAFTGLGNRGLGSAIAVFLFVLILPVMIFNIRRFRIEEERR